MKTTHGTAAGRACLTLGMVVAGLSGCTADDGPAPPGAASAGDLTAKLVAFDSCREALTDLKTAARPYVGPYGFQHGSDAFSDGRVAAAEGDRPAGAPGTAPQGRENAPDHSTTNTHEAGVDEPDIVKTNGRRIVTVVDGVFRVVDVATGEQTGKLKLSGDGDGSDDDGRGYVPEAAQLLTHGDRALVVLNQPTPLTPAAPSGNPGTREPGPRQIAGPELLLIDLSSDPEVVSRMRFDGAYVDARAVDGTVRAVIRSTPRIPFALPDRKTSDQKALRDNRITLRKSGIDDWLPRYEIDNGGSVTRGRVDCGQVQRAAASSGASLLTVMTFDLQASLNAKQAVSIAADGVTVYGSGTSLYVANDQRRAPPLAVSDDRSTRKPGQAREALEARTEIYKFDISRAGAPRHTATGVVPGYLLNQHSMSEHDGHLRVATTTGQLWARPGEEAESESAIHILAHRDKRLTKVGSVTGLGTGERIYAVRFAGPVGYVVTFRQTDPLYTVDLSDPRHPKTTGELKITGYSAYLHPAGDGRLIGVGQEASKRGVRRGTQISLFDVSDPAAPRRLAQHHVKHSTSEAEFDPHAFLYWPKAKLLVVPLVSHDRAAGQPATRGKPGQPRSGALALRLSDDGFSELGTVMHPAADRDSYHSMVRRSLIIGDTLWTVSALGLQANDATTLKKQGWTPFR